MNRSIALPTFRLEAGVSIAQSFPSKQSTVTLDSPALKVMTDLSLVRAATAHPGTSLRQAEQMMIYQGVRMLFVVTDMPSIEGLVTSTDLHGDRQMKVVHERNLRYDELCVADVMTPLALLDAVGFDDMRAATVGHLITTLKRFGRNHMLVVQAATEKTPRRVRGVVSRSQIERQLGSNIEITPVATNFSEIERALA
jgi:CBS-domain-containing membrane protein